MNFPWLDDKGLEFGLTLGLLLLILLLVSYVLYKTVRRKIPLIMYGVLSSLLVTFYVLGLNFLAYFALALVVTNIILCLFVNLGDLRKFLSNPFKVTKANNNSNKNVKKIYDHDALLKELERAVISLSNSKTGAIITLEKETSLKDIMKNGVPVNAPVTAELLVTIFYPGTRLHDGAVVIHDNEILAANVFFTPTTKVFAGKYGSRHRAAIGISEISDTVTIVVSEETGRISFAVNGTLESVDQSNFTRMLENLLYNK